MYRKITVLVAIYKAGKFIEAKIENLKKQTIFKDCNIILLNCQDLDKESHYYKEFFSDNDNITEIFHYNHVKLYKSWNNGIQETSSKYIINSNVDDMWDPNYLKECVKFLDNNESYACVTSQILVTDIPNQYDHTSWKHVSKIPSDTYPNTTAGPSPMWRRSLHKKYGYFGDYHVVGDDKMWEKWYAGGEKFGLINRDMVLYYMSVNSLERRVDPKTKISLRNIDLNNEKSNKNKKTTNTKKVLIPKNIK